MLASWSGPPSGSVKEGGARAGVFEGALVERPRCARMLCSTSASVLNLVDLSAKARYLGVAGGSFGQRMGYFEMVGWPGAWGGF